MLFSITTRLFWISSVLFWAKQAHADLAQITQLLESDETVEALTLLDTELQRSPQEMGLRELRVDIGVGMGFGAGVVHRLETQLEKEAGNADNWYLLGRAVLDRERAVAAYEEALRLDPGHARAWMGRGSMQQLNENCEEAEQSFSHALGLDDSLIEAWVGRIRCLVMTEHHEQARELAHRLVEVLPGQTHGWLALAALDENGELEHLKSGLLHLPENEKLLGYCFEAAVRWKKLDLALEMGLQLEQAGALQYQTPVGLLRDVAADRLSWEALTQVLEGRSRGLSVAELAQWISQYPESNWLQLVYARTLWPSGEVESAETLLKGLLLEIDGGEAHRSLGMLLADAQRPGEAAEIFLALTEILPEDMEAQVVLAMALVDAGAPQLAREQLEIQLKQSPNHRGLRYTQAYVLMLVGDDLAAVRACQDYLQYWPDQGVATWLTGAAIQSEQQQSAHETLSWLLRETGNQAYVSLMEQL